MFLKNKKTKVLLVVLMDISAFICIFFCVYNKNDISNGGENEKQKIEMDRFKSKKFEINDFDDLADVLSGALSVLYKSKSYPPGFTYLFEYLASDGYNRILNGSTPKTNGILVRLGIWVIEFETGTVTGTFEQGGVTVYLIGTIDFEKKPMVIKLEIKGIMQI